MAQRPEDIHKQDLFTIRRFPSGRPLPDQAARYYTGLNTSIADLQAVHRVAYQEHTESSRRFLQDTARGLSGAALILGLGTGIDIPLSEFAEQFDKITVVDLDEKGVRQTLGKLPEADQGKFTVIIDDLSGIAGAYIHAVEGVKDASTFQEYVRRLTESTRSIQPPTFSIPDTFDFISSSLVMTQLASIPVRYAEEVAELQYGVRNITITPQTIPFHDAMTELSIGLVGKHVDFLGQHVKPHGKVYLSDTLIRTPTARRPITQEVYATAEPTYMLSPQDLLQQIDRNFTISEERQWNYYQKPPARAISRPTSGSQFLVDALSLTPTRK